MATVRLVRRPSSKHDAFPVFYIRIIHKRACRAVSTRIRDDGSPSALARAEARMLSYRRAAETLAKSGADYSAGDVTALASRAEDASGILEYVARHAAELKAAGRTGTARIFRKLHNNLQSFPGGDKWLLHRTDGALVSAFHRHLAARGVSRNTLAAYMRPLRGILRKAHGEGLLALDSRWFDGIYFGIDKTEKRAVGRRDMQRIASLDLSAHPKLAAARDMCLFAFYAMGMPFVDLAHLTRDNLHGDCIAYRRRKTGQLITVPLNPQLRELIRRYESPLRSRLFPAMGDATAVTYDSALRAHNQRLKKIGEMAGLPVPLTSYVMRHTWATLAREVNTPISIISGALGHTSERTTRIYLDSISNPVLAEANLRITDLGR